MKGDGGERREPGSGLGTLQALQALAEPNRLRIVELLRAGPLTVGEIAKRLGLRQPQASKHLKVLTESGILEMTADANRRIYGLSRRPFRALEAWMEPFRRTMEERYDNLEDYLSRLRRESETEDDSES